MKALISVIVPVYKVEKYLERCVDSILAQTYENLEIILVDDGSPDSCGSICDRYAQTDNRIKVIHKENAGLGMARNSGLDICTGDYIMFVDSDDYLSEDAIQILYDRLVSDNSDMAVGKHTDIYEDGQKNGAFCSWMKDDVVKTQDMLMFIRTSKMLSATAWGKLYKRHIFETIRYGTVKCGEDLMVFPQILDRCADISIVDREIYYYFQRKDSIVHQLSEEARMDDLWATIRFTKYLLERNAYDGATDWYFRSIHRIYGLRDRKCGLALLKESFDSSTEKMFLKRLGLKQRFRRWALPCPALFDLYMWIKKMIKR